MADGYKDRWVKVLGSLVASVTVDSMGRPNSIFERLAKSEFYADIIAGFLITLAIWEIIKTITVKLDYKHGWFEKPLERFLLQLILGVAAPIFLSFAIVLIYMKLIWDQDIFQMEWLYNEIYMVIFIILIINFIYFNWWLYLKYVENTLDIATVTDTATANSIPDAEKEASILVTKGEKTVLLPPSEIAHIHLVDGYTYIQKFDGEDFVSTLSLDEFFKCLDRNRFFRTNRQIILQKKACTSYRTIENGKMEVEIVPKLNQRVIVSQKRAKEFRKWISNQS